MSPREGWRAEKRGERKGGKIKGGKERRGNRVILPRPYFLQINHCSFPIIHAYTAAKPVWRCGDSPARTLWLTCSCLLFNYCRPISSDFGTLSINQSIKSIAFNLYFRLNEVRIAEAPAMTIRLHKEPGLKWLLQLRFDCNSTRRRKWAS